MSLAAIAILVEFKAKTWYPTARDNDATNFIMQHYNIDKKVGSFWKKLFESPELKTITTVCGAARKFHETKTLPWMSSGMKMDIMRVVNQGIYAQEMQRKKMEYALAVDNFILSYPSLVNAEKNRLGQLWKQNDYPDVSSIKGKFEFYYKFYPLPDPKTCEDFRNQLTEQQYNNLREDVEAEFNSSQRDTMQGLWKKIYDNVHAIYSRMEDEDKSFRKNVFTNLQDLCDILPDLNIGDDPALNDMAGEIKDRLLQFDPVFIRKHDAARKSVSQEAKSILSTINSYIN